jgi:flagellin-specific chaperone FliS
MTFPMYRISNHFYYSGDAKWRRAEEFLRQKNLECVEQKNHIKQLEDMIESLSRHLDAADKRVDHCEGLYVCACECVYACV